MADLQHAMGQRVLVVDDEEVVHASLRRILGKRGFEVETVFSAQQGLDLLQRQPTDLVITDLMMPGMSGIALMQSMRVQGIQVPVIMITGYPTIRTAVQAMRLGARDYVSKPFTRKELLGPVLRALRQDDAVDAPSSAEARGAGEPRSGAERSAQDMTVPVFASLQPGDTLYLPHHAWARFEQDGIFSVGVESSFLQAVGALTRVDCGAERERVEQGSVAIRLTNEASEEHGVVMPLTGQIVAVNATALAAPGTISAESWLLRVLPSHLDDEVASLMLR